MAGTVFFRINRIGHADDQTRAGRDKRYRLAGCFSHRLSGRYPFAKVNTDHLTLGIGFNRVTDIEHDNAVTTTNQVPFQN